MEETPLFQHLRHGTSVFRSHANHGAVLQPFVSTSVQSLESSLIIWQLAKGSATFTTSGFHPILAQHDSRSHTQPGDRIDH